MQFIRLLLILSFLSVLVLSTQHSITLVRLLSLLSPLVSLYVSFSLSFPLLFLCSFSMPLEKPPCASGETSTPPTLKLYPLFELAAPHVPPHIRRVWLILVKAPHSPASIAFSPSLPQSLSNAITGSERERETGTFYLPVSLQCELFGEPRSLSMCMSTLGELIFFSLLFIRCTLTLYITSYFACFLPDKILLTNTATWKYYSLFFFFFWFYSCVMNFARGKLKTILFTLSLFHLAFYLSSLSFSPRVNLHSLVSRDVRFTCHLSMANCFLSVKWNPKFFPFALFLCVCVCVCSRAWLCWSTQFSSSSFAKSYLPDAFVAYFTLCSYGCASIVTHRVECV